MQRYYTKYVENGKQYSSGRTATIFYGPDGPSSLLLCDGSQEVYSKENPEDWHTTAINWVDHGKLPVQPVEPNSDVPF